eukprot:gnl/MRDRNA2_/MRDRNA2_126935_c0_seq1.p1 gnl/MRDRNA2_/MRDRNA2_126935_c0~~gnl/MRDRNA2_/MRDRNA2_126935_c0_seq1.p1  ORF type:complete len:455 (-),score=74.56 gnl/MRDRNA2_/MRDRNA2_126935_c0_seq1:15-1379(-)
MPLHTAAGAVLGTLKPLAHGPVIAVAAHQAVQSAFLAIQSEPEGHHLHKPEDHSTDTTKGLSLPLVSFLFALLSAISLPLGGMAGWYFHPVNEHTVARLMSFGAGSLLFAVTIELYGATLHEIEAYGEKYGEVATVPTDYKHIENRLFFTYYKMALSLLACVAGAWAYLMFNRKLSSWAKRQGGESGEIPANEEPGVLPMHTPWEVSHHEHKASMVVNIWKNKLQRSKSQKLAEGGDSPGPSRAQSSVSVDSPVAAKVAVEEPPKEKDTGKKLAAAVAILAGVLVDGFAEGVLIGFLAAHRNLSIDFIASVFLANFPEAFSTTSLLLELHQPTWKIMAAWVFLALLTATIAGLTTWTLTGIDLHGLLAQLMAGMVEGLAAGAMMMMIISVMVPEAFEVEGDVSAMIMILGFIVSITLTVSAGYVDHVGAPRCVVAKRNVPGDGNPHRVEVMDCE